MEFIEIGHHLLRVYLIRHDELLPLELEALAGTLDRLLPLLTTAELGSIQFATNWPHLKSYVYKEIAA